MFDQFSKEQLKRYSRHFILPEMGAMGQKKLFDAAILVVGAGGLGAPVLQYLAAAGVGHLGIIDFDTVELSNLQRQVLFTEADVGMAKAEIAANRLQKANSDLKTTVFEDKLTTENALKIIKEFDIVVDGTDNFPTRYLINDACVLLDKPYVYGSIYRYEGQVSVFNYVNNAGERGPTYRDLYPEPPAPEAVPNCEDGGVLGALAGIIGSVQANEAIKVITGIGTPLSGRLFILDSLNFENRTIKLKLGSSNYEVRELIDYDEFCSMSENQSPYEVKEVTVQELDKMLKDGKEIQLLDVRTEFEHHVANLGGKLIPLEDLVNRVDEIDRKKEVIVYCKVGIRSMEAILHLQSIYNFNNLYNLKGGINAWATEIDNKFAG